MEGCDLEVHEEVCSQPEDAQPEVHIQFGSAPDQKVGKYMK